MPPNITEVILLETAINKFRRNYQVPPNTITVGYEVAHRLRHFARYTLFYKPVKVDERGNLRIYEIPIIVDYEYPDKIEISINMKVR